MEVLKFDEIEIASLCGDTKAIPWFYWHLGFKNGYLAFRLVAAHAGTDSGPLKFFSSRHSLPTLSARFWPYGYSAMIAERRSAVCR
eukprot:3725579-Pleurochrysis_carterae.AAC.1